MEMEIILNGIKEKIPKDMTIAGLISYFNEKDTGLIVELNKRYVFPHDYETTLIKSGDVIEFINPDFGG
ncbi:MAG: sulfur carrier protein ThiS [Syntrophorhabdaceae bacterium]|nr:sulfur carrier protein ThiS [Syntrophorhabdales bacterium]MBP9561643.1 sulfur carrier protein ThiS [Syntrophorhabdaceae bacterium]